MIKSPVKEGGTGRLRTCFHADPACLLSRASALPQVTTTTGSGGASLPSRWRRFAIPRWARYRRVASRRRRCSSKPASWCTVRGVQDRGLQLLFLVRGREPGGVQEACLVLQNHHDVATPLGQACGSFAFCWLAVWLVGRTVENLSALQWVVSFCRVRRMRGVSSRRSPRNSSFVYGAISCVYDDE